MSRQHPRELLCCPIPSIMLLCVKFCSSLFLKFYVSCRDAQELKKVEVENLKLLLSLHAGTYHRNITDCFYSF